MLSTNQDHPTVRYVSIWKLALGYFAAYLPYAALTKATTDGVVGGAGPVPGLVLLPSVVMATTAAMILFVLVSGWGRFTHGFRMGRLRLPRPDRYTAISGVCAAAIIGTTTIAYSFEGVSIVLMMLLMRGGVLIIAPTVDRITKRRIHWFSWAGLGLALSALLVVFSADSTRNLTLYAALDVAVYLGGYFVRFQVMARRAKSADELVNRVYFFEEMLVATPLLLGVLGVLALIGGSVGAAQLREGFTGFFGSPALVYGLLIGVLYQCLYVFGTLIYLRKEEQAYCVPVNRASSILAGVVASFLLVALAGYPALAWPTLIATGLLLAALAVLAVPDLRPPPARIVFVCRGNRCRSPLAAAIARHELAARLGARAHELVQSAGLQHPASGALDPAAIRALRSLGIDDCEHQVRSLTETDVDLADEIYCLARPELEELCSRFPRAIAKATLLDPEADLVVDHHDDEQVSAVAGRIQARVRSRWLPQRAAS